MFCSSSQSDAIAALISGGLDSAIMVDYLLQSTRADIYPVHMATDLRWAEREQQAASDYIDAIATPRLKQLVQLRLPLAHVYAPHWSVSGPVPDAATADSAVYLPRRNTLLLEKALKWCSHQQVSTICLGTLRTSPFPDAQTDFLDRLASRFGKTSGWPVRIIRPFGDRDKIAVMHLAGHLPLQLTFSCLSPHGKDHCGACNKCAERQQAFLRAELPDPTSYASRQETHHVSRHT